MVLMYVRRGWSATVCAVLAVVLAGCTDPAGSNQGAVTHPGPITVVAAVYPLAYAAEQVGGGQVEVNTLATGGVEPHEQELTAKQVASVERADVVVYVPGLSAAVDAAVGQSSAKVVDALAAIGSHRRSGDPHLWLNPVRLAEVGDAIAEQLGIADPGHAKAFAAAAIALRSSLSQLDADIKNMTRTCDSRLVVTTHTAFGYFASRYNFRQVSILGADPEAEPSPAALARIVRLVRQNRITTLYGEAGHTSKALNAVAAETGTSVRLLQTMESPPRSLDYPAAMRETAATISAGQGCIAP